MTEPTWNPAKAAALTADALAVKAQIGGLTAEALAVKARIGGLDLKADDGRIADAGRIVDLLAELASAAAKVDVILRDLAPHLSASNRRLSQTSGG